LKSVEKQAGTKEIRDLLKNSMAGREMLICFWCLGPIGSDFAIQKASREGWLAEHMFVMGAHGPKGRVTYFTGAPG
jgi:GTP-dependent phosphoenolpyruvate carboxykinase